MPARSRQIGDRRRGRDQPAIGGSEDWHWTLLVDDVVLRFTTSREQDVARADQLLQEALAREMNISMAHFAMGVLRRIQVRLNDSQIELQAAIALDRCPRLSAAWPDADVAGSTGRGDPANQKSDPAQPPRPKHRQLLLGARFGKSRLWPPG